jgi:hypothetical protein
MGLWRRLTQSEVVQKAKMAGVRIQPVILSRVLAERALKDLLVRRRSFGRFAPSG